MKPRNREQSIADLDSYFRALVNSTCPPALAITVRDSDGEVVYNKAFGITDGLSQRSAQPTDLYHFWSVTKLFSATAVMQLVERGKVSLDAPTTAYVPEFRFVGTDNEDVFVTIRQLLNHTSGMRDLKLFDLVGWISDGSSGSISQLSLVRTSLGPYRKLKRAPGTKASYSNAGYIVLGAIVEAVAGENYES